MAFYKITFVRRQAVTRVIEADAKSEALRIGDELLSSDFYNEIDEEMTEVFDPDTVVEAREITGYQKDGRYMSNDVVASYIGEE